MVSAKLLPDNDDQANQQPYHRDETHHLAQAAKTRPSQLMLPPHSMPMALEQLAKQAQWLADAGAIAPLRILPK